MVSLLCSVFPAVLSLEEKSAGLELNAAEMCWQEGKRGTEFGEELGEESEKD